MMPLLLAQIERLHLAGPDEPLFTRGEWLGFTGFIALCLILGALISHHAWRDRQRATPCGRSGRLLAAALGLSRKQRMLLTALARDSGVLESNLLLCRGAFDRAASERGEREDLAELRWRVFPSRSTVQGDRR